ncbi:MULTISPECIES: gamma-glutamyltransferase [unclassified Cyanobium]|uniref:gamma-glutamyltransferase n=1 Tax=unclassified Cyanobium TaxID=2627006 RepID=UPI0020CEEE8A|nr:MULTISPECIES: gamma-glutamyltransferase [unclassified Cyanobium]MCP9857564.1 gamma-glutamyltransferase [Cyanobium sp. Cruz-8H5]MCP9864863.1 gamma-glutamyltransferase [Cyanobium sp. Cruz-8D1]
MSAARRGAAAAALLLLAGTLAVPVAQAQAPAVLAPPESNVLLEGEQRFRPLWSARGLVAAQEPLASAAGAAILRQGGNAVDGAVATAFALAVTLPQAGNLGGGGFLLLWLPGPSPARARGCLAEVPPGGQPRTGPELAIGGGTAVAVNFRETAPAAATATMFLGPDGQVDRARATRSLLSSAVPGTVAGLALAQRCYGRLPLQVVMAPAIRLAAQGFPVSRELSDSLAAAAPRLQADPASRRQFLPAPPPGTRLRQSELAATLRRIAAEGERGFYRGPVADALVAVMERGGGLITRADLRAYRARLVAPLQGRFRGHPLLTMPPPGGGLTLLQILAILEPFDLAGSGLNAAASLHPMAEAMNLAYRDRNALLGDPEQGPVPVERLLSPAHIEGLRRRLDPRRHTPAPALEAASAREGTNTTHLSVADRQGGLVALTTTLNFPYGNGISVPGLGFLLNNEMDDFSALPGSANAFGLRQGAANAIAPGRRPLSSMAPTLLFRPDGRPWIATGSPGGSRIITTVLQVLLNRVVHGLNLASAVAAPRIHSQLWPDRIDVEQGVSPDSRRLLEAMGHNVRQAPAMGAANSVEVLEAGGSLGAVDPRRAEGPAVPE